jgi:hypothetical protein
MGLRRHGRFVDAEHRPRAVHRSPHRPRPHRAGVAATASLNRQGHRPTSVHPSTPSAGCDSVASGGFFFRRGGFEFAACGTRCGTPRCHCRLDAGGIGSPPAGSFSLRIPSPPRSRSSCNCPSPLGAVRSESFVQNRPIVGHPLGLLSSGPRVRIGCADAWNASSGRCPLPRCRQPRLLSGSSLAACQPAV